MFGVECTANVTSCYESSGHNDSLMQQTDQELHTPLSKKASHSWNHVYRMQRLVTFSSHFISGTCICVGLSTIGCTSTLVNLNPSPAASGQPFAVSPCGRWRPGQCERRIHGSTSAQPGREQNVITVMQQLTQQTRNQQACKYS